MRSICYVCGILFDIKPPFDNDAETHGICDECWTIVRPALKEEMKGRHTVGFNPISSETKHKTLIPASRGTGRQSVRKS